jgi:hypothetical protein
MVSFSLKYKNIAKLYGSELHVCLEGIRLALDICQEDVIVETDNLVLTAIAK